MNIWSGARGDELAAALTNPTTWSRRKGNTTRDYAVVFRGAAYPDAEAAYHAAKEFSGDVEVMAQVICAKFQQHPVLLGWIEARGGRAWLEACSHFTGARSERMKKWEGTGVNSLFIRALLDGYDRAVGAV